MIARRRGDPTHTGPHMKEHRGPATRQALPAGVWAVSGPGAGACPR